MIWLKIPIGAFLLGLSVALPAACMGFVLGGKPGAVIGAAIGLAMELGLLLSGDRGVKKRLHAVPADTPGFERTAQLAMARYGLDEQFDIPYWFIYPDASPGIIAVRSPFSRGTVFVSEGLIALLEEEELRAALAGGVRLVRAPGVVIRTLCLKFLLMLATIAPMSWKSLVYRANTGKVFRKGDNSPLSLVAFAALLPFIGFYQAVGRNLTAPVRAVKVDPAESSAMHKVRQTRILHGRPTSDTAVFAGLVNLALER